LKEEPAVRRDEQLGPDVPNRWCFRARFSWDGYSREVANRVSNYSTGCVNKDLTAALFTQSVLIFQYVLDVGIAIMGN